MTAERRSAKETRHRNQFSMAAYGQSSFSLIRSARRLNVVAQAGPIPPVDENTSGTKLAPSTSRTRCSYSRLLLRSCFAYWLARGACMADGAFGWNTLTSKNSLSLSLSLFSSQSRNACQRKKKYSELLSINFLGLYPTVVQCMCACHNEKKCQTNGKHDKRYRRYFKRSATSTTQRKLQQE